MRRRHRRARVVRVGLAALRRRARVERRQDIGRTARARTARRRDHDRRTEVRVRSTRTCTRRCCDRDHARAIRGRRVGDVLVLVARRDDEHRAAIARARDRCLETSRTHRHPPRLRLSTFAEFAFAGTPLTVPPDAHVIASTMSGHRAAALAEHAHGDDLRAVRHRRDAFRVVRERGDRARHMRAVPARVRGRNGRRRTRCLPYQSPSSFGFESRPLPSRASAAVEMKS